MPLLEWKDSYSIGIAAVDHEHRELIDLINTAHDELTASAGGGPGRRNASAIFGDIYRGIHERLLDELRDIMDDYDDGGDVGEAESAHLSERLGAWFARHFKTHDTRLHSRLGTHPHD